MVKQEIVKMISKKLSIKPEQVILSVSDQENFGDFSYNALIRIEADQKAKNDLVRDLEKSPLIEKVDLAGPGFLNIFLSEKGFQDIVADVNKEKENYGKGNNNGKVQVEYISANPTGPLTLGNGRGGFGGECIARVYEFLGYDVEREYYINNIGRQIEILGSSVLKALDKKQNKYKERELYQGEYVKELAKKIKISEKDNLLQTGQKAAKVVVEQYLKPAIKDVGINFDNWFEESTLYDSKVVDKALTELDKQGLIYEKEGAFWFKSKQFGDQEDRVIKRKNGEYTYFASDIGYAYDRFKNRKFDKVIMLLGADHHGYVKSFKAMLKAFKWEKQWDPKVFQLVTVMKAGKPVRMSKRKGVFYLLHDLVKQVNPDVAKFVFLSKDFNTHLNIDLEALTAKSKQNPVYYLQYAFARIKSLERKQDEIKPEKQTTKEYRYNQEEKELIIELTKFKEVVRTVGKNLDVHLLAFYTNSLAQKFHSFYKASPILQAEPKTREKRWQLVQATKYVLKNSLELMGISQPDIM